jgi:hypothetical protein
MHASEPLPWALTPPPRRLALDPEVPTLPLLAESFRFSALFPPFRAEIVKFRFSEIFFIFHFFFMMMSARSQVCHTGQYSNELLTRAKSATYLHHQAAQGSV